MENSTSNIIVSNRNSSSHLGDVTVPALRTTAIPLREEFRCRRLWFFYHDIRAFTTSWLPLPLFLAFRILVFLYALAWLILHIVARADTSGPHWLIFISDLGYSLLVFSTCLMALLTLTYTVTYYSKKKDRFICSIPKKDFPVFRIYKQDNIAWYVKITWAIYIIANGVALMIFIGYWGLLYRSCPSGSASSGVSAGNSSGTGDDDNADGSSGVGDVSPSNCSATELDVYTIHVHGVNLIIVLLDLIFSRVPYQFLHIFYPSIFTLVYIIFSLVYWRTGGANPDGNNYIYSNLDYTNNISYGFAAAFVIGPIAAHVFLFLLAWLRDAVLVHICCCFRDVRARSYRESVRSEIDEAEENGEEITKM